MQNNKIAVAAAVVIGLILIAVGVIYITTPASGLPAFLPGHTATGTAHHTKHGLLAIGLGICAIIAARFVGGPSANAPLS